MPRASHTLALEARHDETMSVKRNVSSPREMPAVRSYERFCSQRDFQADRRRPVHDEALMTPEDVVPLHLADVTYPESHPLAGQDGLVLASATGPADASIERLREFNADRIHFSHDRAVLRRRK